MGQAAAPILDDLLRLRMGREEKGVGKVVGWFAHQTAAHSLRRGSAAALQDFPRLMHLHARTTGKDRSNGLALSPPSSGGGARTTSPPSSIEHPIRETKSVQ
jgi:hypothetical protein